MATEERLLSVRGLSKAFQLRGRVSRRLVALDDVSLDVRTHEIVGVVGESGSGKSTLAKCLVRLVEPDAGTVEFHARDVLSLRGRELARARRQMQMVYQDPYSSLNPLMSVGAAIAEPARVHGLVRRGAEGEHVREALDVVGLNAALAARRPRELSGGQRQRVAIARAMAVRPELLLADEAVSALDVSIQAQILNLFASLRDEHGVAIVFIAHNLSVVAHIADRVNVMYLGAIVETGPTKEVFAAPGHPYTAALLDAQPGRHRRRTADRPVLRGEIPSPLNIPTGCRFRTRCPLAQDVCAEQAPPVVDLGGGRTARCHFASRHIEQSLSSR
ncbi:MAG TPA: ABC transporter ATP-binding protein [Conexibacter sp.]|nr:ABC transporter ATP-binding protein [Conexibacter sp.]